MTTGTRTARTQTSTFQDPGASSNIDTTPSHHHAPPFHGPEGHNRPPLNPLDSTLPACRRCSPLRPHHLHNPMQVMNKPCPIPDKTTPLIRYIPDTEIDWRTYMQQIHLYTLGERDYAKLSGDTGPLVYPAAHVYIYRLLYTLTNAGQNIALAQWLFVTLYLLTLWTVMQCYRAANVPPWVFPLLSLSKRAHSIFMLRLFNDCFAVLFLWVAVALWQRKLWTLGTLVFGFGVGVKMSLLLALPAVGVVLWLGMGRNRAFYQAQVIGQLQVSTMVSEMRDGSLTMFCRRCWRTRSFWVV